MSERVELRGLSREQAERLKSEHEQSGATELQIVKQPDGAYTLSFLPGDDDFPTAEESSLPGESDFPTDAEGSK